MDLKNDKGSVKKGEGKADCTIQISDDDFVSMAAGRTSASSSSEILVEPTTESLPGKQRSKKEISKMIPCPQLWISIAF